MDSKFSIKALIMIVHNVILNCRVLDIRSSSASKNQLVKIINVPVEPVARLRCGALERLPKAVRLRGVYDQVGQI